MLKWCNKAYGMKYTVLRYFNVAGAHESGEIGEAHTTETHLIPIVLQVAAGEREKLEFTEMTIRHKTEPVFEIIFMSWIWQMLIFWL